MNYEVYMKDSYTSADMWRVTRWLERGGFSYYVTATANHFTLAYVADAAQNFETNKDAMEWVEDCLEPYNGENDES